ncbi:MAG: cobalamin-dependent protein [Desulfobacteraceae bacterium]|nr:cobalamin-dependent protein [Desulfobacteraceae bacterium]
MKNPPFILCVNPWIHDFAAYDFWARPLGLLYLAGLLRASGCRVGYIDCLDRFHPRDKHRPCDPSFRCGRGPYKKIHIPKPRGLEDVPRRYSRYGIDPQWFESDLNAAGRPDLVLMTCVMAYWYPGAAETAGIIKSVYPGVPVVLGGIYATLYPHHASGLINIDEVVTGPGEQYVFELVEKYTGLRPAAPCGSCSMDTAPYPALDLQNIIPYVPMLASRGCPFSCDYCASSILQPEIERRDPRNVFEEILFWHGSFGVKDFAFYDDALLLDAQNHADILFSMIRDSGVKLRLHTPNALHVRNISRNTAVLMRGAGMKTVRLGLETAEFKGREIDRKIRAQEFEQAAAYLREAGFSRNEVGAYLLAGLPGQDQASVEFSINIVKAAGIMPVIAYYSPIYGTKMWDAAKAASRYDLESDPVFTNNAVMPCQPVFSWELASRFKKRIRS